MPRSNSAIGLGVSCTFLAMLAAGLFANHGVIEPLALNLAVWFFLFVGAYASLSFGRRLLRPLSLLQQLKRGACRVLSKTNWRLCTTGGGYTMEINPIV